MIARRISKEYEDGVEAFLCFAQQHGCSRLDGKYRCPCVNCLNGIFQKVDDIREHLLCDGILKCYTVWTWHGELLNIPTSSVSAPEQVPEHTQDRLEDMIQDVGADSFLRAHVYDTLKSDSETPLYDGCLNFTRLSAVLKLMNLKATNGWTDKSFSELLKLLKEMLPEGNTLPDRNYEAKKVLCPMGLEYKKIHACPNDCILYRKEYKELHKCPRCGLSRYKSKDNDVGSEVTSIKDGPPAKVLWYLPIIPRLKRLFANADDAKHLRWHAEERVSDGKIRHVADSLQWKKIDNEYPEFGSQSRNLRLGLATDGMNPFGNLSSNHSSWPVLLVIYNLPPWLCMKRKYVMLSMMISGPKQPGNDIDVYLGPLIEDLKLLWDEGVDVYDGFSGENFKLRALLFCTINDFPAYANLSGYSTKGHKACPICEEGTCYHQLQHGRKTVYLGHRRFLRKHHPYRRLKKAFNGCSEEREAPKALSGEQVFARVKDVNVVFGKSTKKSAITNIWKKRSIFFNLPYWCKLDVRHCLDVMHVEKNVCDSLIGTLLNIKGKTKDSLNARLDMAEMNIRDELKPVDVGNRKYLPPACYTLSKKERSSFCHCLRGVKVPTGYSSNIKSLVSIQDLKLVGLKSHDCHVLMQQLLPVAIRGILPKKVRMTVHRLCSFFNAICSKVIDPKMLDELEAEVATILCQLEMFFPPAFFDIMVHLVIHLVREIRLCGPVYLRWMYPVERYMKILKGYVKNQYRPEASIVERYIAEEAIEFCSEYISNAFPIGLPKSRHFDRLQGKCTRGGQMVTKVREDVLQADLYILNNIDEVLPYITSHKDIVRRNNPKQSEKWLLHEHNKTFRKWFEAQILKENPSSETLRWLGGGLKFEVFVCNGYDINNISFYTKSLDDRSRVQNSGVCVEAESMQFSSAKDKNPVLGSMPYYGIIQEIWEVSYTKFKVPVFKCQWIDNKNGVERDHFGMTRVDFLKVGYKDEPFIMAHQATQVFYVKDPSNERWSVVLRGKNTQTSDEELGIHDTPSFTCYMPPTVEELLVDDVHATRDDHSEGIYI